jgi:CubicO group peptidase (beta-lactamase class C family)
MTRRGLMAGTALLAATAAAHAASTAPLDDILHPYLVTHGLPAFAAAVVRNGHVTASGAVGTRRAGTTIPVTIDDKFHIGSDTKAMTSTLAGILVEKGALHWDGTVAESFPELVSNMDEALRSVTLQQLLSHTSGIPADNDAFGKLLEQSYAQEGKNLDELRYWLVTNWVPMSLANKPGTTFAYSNMGYTMAGAMIERAAKSTWEELIVAHIFTPLKLRSAGFGPQSSLGQVDAPLGHLVNPDDTLKPMLAGPNGDNPLILGPAGTVHLSILDFAAWAGWQAGEGKRGPAIVTAATLRKLHQPVINISIPSAAPGTPSGTGSYCLGWGILTLPFSKEPFITHTGSNTLNLAMVMLQPQHDFAMVLATNRGDKRADAALRDAAATLYRQHGPT